MLNRSVLFTTECVRCHAGVAFLCRLLSSEISPEPREDRKRIHIRVWDSGKGFSPDILAELQNIDAYLESEDYHIGITNVILRARHVFHECSLQSSGSGAAPRKPAAARPGSPARGRGNSGSGCRTVRCNSLPVPKGHLDEFQNMTAAFNDMVCEIKDLKIDVYERKLRAQNLEAQFLKQQITPHFLICRCRGSAA